MEAFSVHAEVPGGPGATYRARAFVRAELDGRLDDDQVGDVALLVTELVANGVRHGGVGAGRCLRLRLQGRADTLRVEVGQPDGGRERIRLRPPDLRGGGGFGLHLVDRVASRWGVAPGSQTRVWFELDGL